MVISGQVVRDCALRPETSRVLAANPMGDTVKLAHGTEVANATTFRHLKNMGWTPKQMDDVIPIAAPNALHIQEIAPLGKLYGYTIALDYNARFQFFNTPLEVEEVATLSEDICEHGFVVRDVQGDNRFLCRECDERFPRHPDMMDQEAFRPDEAEVFDYVAQFRDGLITLADVFDKTKLSLEELTATMNELFPQKEMYQDEHTLGGKVHRTMVGYEPIRTSCPADIEALFGNPEVTVTDINTVIQSDVFRDIESVDHIHLPHEKMMRVEVSFCDGSMQRIEITEFKRQFQGQQMRRTFKGSRHHMEPGMLMPEHFEEQMAKKPLIHLPMPNVLPPLNHTWQKMDPPDVTYRGGK